MKSRYNIIDIELQFCLRVPYQPFKVKPIFRKNNRELWGEIREKSVKKQEFPNLYTVGTMGRWSRPLVSKWRPTRFNMTSKCAMNTIVLLSYH